MGWFVPLGQAIAAAAPAAGGAVAAGTAATTATTIAASTAGTAALAPVGVSAIAAPAAVTAQLGATAGMTLSTKLLLGASLASGAAGAYGQHAAGKAAEKAAKLEGKQVADAARGREIERRRSLLAALSSQVAQAGASGVSTSAGTSLAAAASRDIKDMQRDRLTDTVNTGRARNLLRASARSARFAGGLGAATSLLDTATSAYKISR